MILIVVPGASGTGATAASIQIAQTVQLTPGLNGSQIGFPATSAWWAAPVQSATLSFQTPSSMDTQASNLSVFGPSTGRPVWTWSGAFGQSAVSGSSGPVTANNGTAQGSILLPIAALSPSAAELSSGGHTLSGDYSLELQVGQYPAVSRSGAQQFGPLTPVQWAMPASGTITSAASAIAPNGSIVVAIGDSTGHLTVYSAFPGLDGVILFQGSLASPNPVSDVVIRELSASGLLTIAAGDGGDVFLLSQIPNGQFHANVLTPPNSIQAQNPSVEQVCLLTYGDGTPAVVATTSDGFLTVSNWTGSGINGGWTTLSVLTRISGSPRALSSYTGSSNGTDLIAVAGPSAVEMYSVNGTSFSGGAAISVGSAGPDSLAFDSTGQHLFVGGSDGKIYALSSPSWSAQALALAGLGGSPLVSLDAVLQSNPLELVLISGNSTIYVAQDPLSSTPTLLDLGQVASSDQASSPQVAPLDAPGEPDILLADGGSMWFSQWEGTFSSALIPEWSNLLAQASASITPTTDPYGDRMVTIPIHLTVTGGTATLGNTAVEYNLTSKADITASIRSFLSASKNHTSPFEILIDSGSPGMLHVTLDLTFQGPSSVAWFEPAVVLISRYGFLAAAAALAIGAVLVLWGNRGHRPTVQLRKSESGPWSPEVKSPGVEPSATPSSKASSRERQA